MSYNTLQEASTYARFACAAYAVQQYEDTKHRRKRERHGDDPDEDIEVPRLCSWNPRTLTPLNPNSKCIEHIFIGSWKVTFIDEYLPSNRWVSIGVARQGKLLWDSVRPAKGWWSLQRGVGWRVCNKVTDKKLPLQMGDAEQDEGGERGCKCCGGGKQPKTSDDVRK